MNDAGYIRLWRKITDNALWTTLPPAVLKVMLACLLKANWKTSLWYDGHSQVEIPRGSFITSHAKMASFCGLSIKQTRSAFAHLENLQFVTYNQGIDRAQRRAQSRAQHWTMVNVLNYDTYQASLKDEGIAEGVANPSGRATAKEIKNKEYTPPTPSSEGGVLFDVKKNPARRSIGQSSYRATLQRVAMSIHERHPTAHERRDCGVPTVEKKLEAILKHKRLPEEDCGAYLLLIDQNHARKCSSEQWQKDGGEFAKALSNYLAPTMERYDVEPTAPMQKNEPGRLMA
jgi:hypothetical protein